MEGEKKIANKAARNRRHPWRHSVRARIAVLSVAQPVSRIGEVKYTVKACPRASQRLWKGSFLMRSPELTRSMVAPKSGQSKSDQLLTGLLYDERATA